jgi:hypothetical protein
MWSRPELQEQQDLFTWLSGAGAAALNGDAEPARELAANVMMRALVGHDGQWGWHTAEVLALAGLVDEAVDTLAIAIPNGFSNVLMLESRDATLATVRTHVRFPALLAEAKRLDAELDEALREVTTSAARHP